MSDYFENTATSQSQPSIADIEASMAKFEAESIGMVTRIVAGPAMMGFLERHGVDVSGIEFSTTYLDSRSLIVYRHKAMPRVFYLLDDETIVEPNFDAMHDPQRFLPPRSLRPPR